MKMRSKDILIFGLFIYLFLKYALYSMLTNWDFGLEYYYIQLIVAILLVLLGCCSKKNGALLYMTMSALFLYSIWKHPGEDEEFYTEYIIRTLSFIPFFFLDKKYYKLLAIAACIIIMPSSLSQIWFNFQSEVYSNRYALHFVAASLLFIPLIVETKYSFNKKILIFFLLMIPPVLVHSRTAAVSFFVAITLFLLAYIGELPSKEKKRSTQYLIIGAVLVFAVFHNMISDFLFKGKYGDTQGAGSMSSLMMESRGGMWEELSYFTISPWGMESSFTQDVFMLNNIHNGYLQSYIMFGIFPTLAYLSIILYAIYYIVKKWKCAEMKKWSILFIPILLLGFSESNFLLDPDYPFFGFSVLVGISMIMQEARGETGESNIRLLLGER